MSAPARFAAALALALWLAMIALSLHSERADQDRAADAAKGAY